MKNKILPNCLVEGELITLSNHFKKPIQNITYEDEVLAYNFDEGKLDKAKLAWISKPHTCDNYWEIKLSNNTILKLVGWGGKSHRLFNLERGDFVYPQDFKETEHTITEEQELVTIISCKNIIKTVTYYNLAPAYRLNYYTNGILVGERITNLYPIKDFKYIKEERNPISEFKLIPKHYIDELRLLEQKEQDSNNMIIYRNTLEEHIYYNYYQQDIRYREYWRKEKQKRGNN